MSSRETTYKPLRNQRYGIDKTSKLY